MQQENQKSHPYQVYPNWFVLEKGIFFIPAQTKPLSSDVVIIEGEQFIWLYDVGAEERIPKQMNAYANSQNKEIKVVLSHFHPDHITNLSQINASEVFVGKQTFSYTGVGKIITQPEEIMDGERKLHIFPIPSSHAKGCLGLEVDETFCFLGDAIYSTTKKQKNVYNAGTLKETIEVLQGIKAPYFASAHREPFVRPKSGTMRFLKEIYQKRQKNDPYIPLE